MTPPRPPTQRSSAWCDDCQAYMTITPTASAYEFEYRCAGAKKHAGVISWAHAHPPPSYEGLTP